MATKSYSNYRNLFDAYRESISTSNTKQKTSAESSISALEEELNNVKVRLKEIENELTVLNRTVETFDDRKSREFLPKVNEAKVKLSSAKSKVLSSEDRAKHVSVLTSSQEKVAELSAEIESLTAVIENPTTAQKDKTAAKSKRTKAENKVATLNSNIADINEKLKQDDANLQAVNEAEAKVSELEEKLKAIQADEESKNRRSRKILQDNLAQINALQKTKKELIVKKNNIAKQIETAKSTLPNIPTSTDGSLEDFEKFLTENGFQTTHAEELYKFFLNGDQRLTIDKNDFKIRKQHPTRDKILKKFGIPALIAGGAVGGATGAISSLTFSAGSKWLFLTLTTNTFINFAQTAVVGAIIGAVAAVTVVKVKDAITKHYYKAKYGDVDKIINNPKSAKLDELLEKVEQAKEEILDSRTGRHNIFSKIGRAVKRTSKNILNRNRIHHIESLTEQLVEKFIEIDSNQELSVSQKLELLDPIYTQLSKINDFYARDIENSKIFALLNCKDKTKNHTHKETIENLDIYAKLSMFLEEVDKKDMSKREKRKVHKSIRKDTHKQKEVANELLNGSSVTGLVARRYNELVKLSDSRETPTSKTVKSFHTVTKNGVSTLYVTFQDGNTTEYEVNSTEITGVRNVNKGNSLLIQYRNGDVDSLRTTPKKTRIDLSVAGEYKVLESLKNEDTVSYLISLGYDESTINELIAGLTASKYTKSGKEKATPSSFIKSKKYREHPEYAEIIKAVNSAIKKPRIKETPLSV